MASKSCVRTKATPGGYPHFHYRVYPLKNGLKFICWRRQQPIPCCEAEKHDVFVWQSTALQMNGTLVITVKDGVKLPLLEQ